LSLWSTLPPDKDQRWLTSCRGGCRIEQICLRQLQVRTRIWIFKNHSKAGRSQRAPCHHIQVYRAFYPKTPASFLSINLEGYGIKCVYWRTRCRHGSSRNGRNKACFSESSRNNGGRNVCTYPCVLDGICCHPSEEGIKIATEWAPAWSNSEAQTAGWWVGRGYVGYMSRKTIWIQRGGGWECIVPIMESLVRIISENKLC